MFYLESDKREIRGWIKKENDEMKTLYNQLSKKIEKVVEQQQISDAQVQNQIQGQITALKEDVDNLGQSTSKAVDEIKSDLNNLGREFVVLDNSLQTSSEIVAALKNEIAELKKNSSPALLPEINSLKKEIGILQTEVAALKDLSAENESLKKEILALRQVVGKISMELAAQKNSVANLEQKLSAAQDKANAESVKDFVPSSEFDALKNTVANLEKKTAAAPSINMNALKNLLDKFKQEIAESVKDFVPSSKFDTLKNFITELEKRIAALESEPEEEPPPETIFYLPERKDIFLPNNREEIIDKVRAALAVGDIEKYLTDNPSDTSEKFQKLLVTHVREAKKFVEKLKLKDLEDEELSETVTTKYFKIFRRTIFDNLLVAIKRGLKGSEEYYLGLLAKVNDYLARCGIYTVNTTSGRKAAAEDYENMSPQTLKTDDATKAESIISIERLPYRINYLDEFGEQKYFQYAGIMNVYKAV